MFSWVEFEDGKAFLKIKNCPEALPGNTFNQ
jgi:hypothetical protein